MERLCTLNTATLSTRTHLAPKPAQNTLNHVYRSFKVTHFGIIEKPTGTAYYCITRMRGKAQPDGRPALQIIKTPFLYFSPLLDQRTRATPLFG